MNHKRDTNTVYPGDRISVQTFMGSKGNIVGRLPDGRAVLFNRDSPYRGMIAPDQSVDCSIIHVSERYIIVDPIRKPEPIEWVEPQELDETDLSEKLRRLSEKGEWETAIFARALTHIIEMFDALKAKAPKHSSPKKDVVMEELVEHSPAPDEFLQAASSFGLTQTYVEEQKAPESDFLRYLDEVQEEEKAEIEEKVEVETPISIRAEAYGTVLDLPKNFRLLTVGQTRYLKEHHLRNLDGYEGIDRFTTFFSDVSALERREYGNVFYASIGTNPWQKVYKVIADRIRD